MLAMVYDPTRECLGLVAMLLSGLRVCRELDRLTSFTSADRRR